MNCDEYYSYNSLAGLVKNGEEEVVKHDPWELVTEAVQRMKRNGDVMRADRLKQVMQQIDSSFDEKDVGKSKFSLFVSEAAKRGLLSLNKLENGQLEVDLPKAEGDAQAATPVEAAPAAQASVETEEDRSRRSSRRGRGRGRDDRGPRGPKPEASTAASASTETAKHPAPAPAKEEIGASGIRLTRDEAFDLVRRAVASASVDGKAASASKVRAEARKLLDRDSESLSERNFIRILHDAHDADIVDLRKRGGDYEVAPAVKAAAVDAQLAKAAVDNAPPAKPAAPVQRGMGARGIGRGFGSTKAGPPPNLLSIGVVGSTAKPAAPAAAPTNTAKPADDDESVAIVENAIASEAPSRGRKKSASKKSAPKSKAAAKSPGKAEAAAQPSAAKRPRAAKKKTAAKAAAGADSK
jgi:hypothetical protein